MQLLLNRFTCKGKKGHYTSESSTKEEIFNGVRTIEFWYKITLYRYLIRLSSSFFRVIWFDCTCVSSGNLYTYYMFLMGILAFHSIPCSMYRLRLIRHTKEYKINILRQVDSLYCHHYILLGQNILFLANVYDDMIRRYGGIVLNGFFL
jgi:hypothetical protein